MDDPRALNDQEETSADALRGHLNVRSNPQTVSTWIAGLLFINADFLDRYTTATGHSGFAPPIHAADISLMDRRVTSTS